MSQFEPSARVIADSVNEITGDRLTTLEVQLHRFMLAEFNTHRAFSRNSASSRAISAERQMQSVTDNPAVPLLWPGERKGMQGGPPLPREKAEAARQTWLRARNEAVACARTLNDLGVHRSITNRLLEPFMVHTVVVSATDWKDFFSQRARPQDGSEPLAQAEIVHAATAMKVAMTESTPVKLTLGQYHLPYIQDWELTTMPTDQAIMVSVARCARTSYLTQNGTRDVAEDVRLYQRLISAQPPHWSPLEHVATPAARREITLGNFTGWHQARHHWR